ncbi:MAG: hypothetical protein ACTSW1_15445 [Candidatus Hodarchaeales archaeon]
MGKIEKYENRVIAFIDILGFSAILDKTQTRKENGESVDNTESIKKLSSAFERIADLMGVNEEPEDSAPSRTVTQFSDSIVISFKQDESAIEFRYLLEELLFLHIDLLRQHILIRGGISYGPVIHTNKILFGPAMVHAYRVESLAAVSPRIILPKSLAEMEKGYDDILRQQAHKLDNLLSLDQEDFYYLDYFDKCQNPDLALFVNDLEYIDHLKNMKQVIINGLKTRNPGIYSKYGWMKTRWNATVRKYHKKDHQDQLFNSKRLELKEYFLDEKLIEDSM